MDVRCDKCGTEYEFEEKNLTDEGVAVRCTECSHVFKVRRRSIAVTEPISAPAAPEAKADQPWMIRRENGDAYTFRDLTTLQKWIVERKVSRGDEISRSGESWKRLGNIAELATFFQVVDQALSTSSGPAEELPDPVSRAVAAPVAQPPPVFVPQPLAPPAPAPAPAPDPTFGPMPVDDFSDLDDDFADFKQGGAGKWVVLVILLVGGGIGGFALLNPDKFQEILTRIGLTSGQAAGDLAQSHLESGWKTLAGDTFEDFAKAQTEFTKAVKLAATPFAQAHAGLAQTHIAWGLALRDTTEAKLAQAQSLAPVPSDDENAAAGPDDQAKARITALQGEAKTLGEQSATHFNTAFDEARKAIEIDDQTITPLCAMAAYYGAQDAKDKLHGLLDRLDEIPGSNKDAQIAWVRGFSLLEDHPPDLAVRHLQAAVELDGSWVRARYDLARAYVRGEDDAKAMVHLKKAIEMSPGHARVQAMIDLLDAKDAPPPQPEPEPVPDPEPKPKPKPATFDGLLSKAFRLRNNGKVERALDLYGLAKDMRPDRAEPYAGQGWCYVEMRAWGAASGSFEQALKRNSRYGEAIIGMAEASKFKGNTEKAKEYYERYLDVLPGGPDAAVARNFLSRN